MKKLYLTFIAALLTCFLLAQDNASLPPETLKKIAAVENGLTGAVQLEGQNAWTIAERMAYYKIKGLSIAVVQHYKIAWAKGYGLSDDSLKTPVTTHTLFQAASISKSLNGVGVLKLAQDHKLDLNTDINKILTSWKFPYDSVSNNKIITVSHLLSHTAGLTVHGFAGYQPGTNIPSLVQILDGKPPANSPAIRSMFEPGLRAEYSGGGVTVSQQIVMDITHMPYAQYMYQQVLKPMGMITSSYEQPYTKIKAALLATGYDRNGTQITGKYHIYPEEAAAGLWTNPTELCAYIIETQLALAGKSAKVLNMESTKLRLTPYIDKSAAAGVFINDHEGTKYFEHSGANEGFRSVYYGSMENGEGLVVMINSDNGNIITEIVNSVAKAYDFKGFYKTKIRKQLEIADTVLLQSYTGKYSLATDFIITISREGNKLFTQATQQPKFPLYAEAQNKFFLTAADTEVEFITGNSGRVEKLILYQNGQKKEAKKE